MKVEFFRHNLDEECLLSQNKAARSLFLTTGPQTREFENAFAKYLNLPYATGTMSCTHALHLAYKALKIGRGDEVIVPAFTFAASVTAILHAGAKPLFTDVEPDTALIDSKKVENLITPKTKAICPVHIFGVMADMNQLSEIAKKYSLKVVEDAAHCIEGERDSNKPGSLSDAVAFSFYATKNITCGEGGALATRDNKIAEKTKVLRNHGMTKNAIDRFEGTLPIYDIEEVGFKSNMYDLQAALLLPQLEKIEKKLERRVEIVDAYNAGLRGIETITTPVIPKKTKSAHHLYTIRVKTKRDEFVMKVKGEGVGCAINYRPLSELTLFKSLGMREKDFPNATAIGNSILSLPLYPSLKNDEVAYVIEKVKKVAKEIL